MTIRARRDGWQVIDYAGLDPLTGKQHQITRQVNDSRRAAKQVEARLRTEVADSHHLGAAATTLGELVELWLPRRATSGKPMTTTLSPRAGPRR